MSAAASPPPILVVDDEPADTYLLRRALRQAGIPNPVIGCGDGEEAVMFLESARFGGQRPCLIFLDVRMPRMNGLEFLEWIRTCDEFSDMKIVVLSGSDHPTDRTRALALGAHEYLVKFPSPEKLGSLAADAIAEPAPEPVLRAPKAKAAPAFVPGAARLSAGTRPAMSRR